MADKPSYLGLLNAIAQGERRAGIYLKAWAEKTPEPAVKQVLQTVALRESEHALAFEKRMCELGFEVMERPDSNFEKNLEIATSTMSDLEKFEALGYRERSEDEERPNLFKDVFTDTSIDIQTGELLGRYIAEEHDSGRMLQGCFEILKGQSRNGAGQVSGMENVTLADVCAQVEKLADAVAKLEKKVAKQK